MAETLGVLKRLTRYPVKGFQGEDLDQADLEIGKGLAGDRLYALVNGRFDAQALDIFQQPEGFIRVSDQTHLPKFRYRLNDETGSLTIHSPDGMQVELRVDEDVSDSQQALLKRWFHLDSNWVPQLAKCQSGAYWDYPNAMLSIINLASIRELGTAEDKVLDRLRFRGNLYVDLAEAWSEFSLLGKTLKIGSATLRVTERIERCIATCVDPATGEVDANIPFLLRKLYGHRDCGVYAKVIEAGIIAPDDEISLL